MNIGCFLGVFAAAHVTAEGFLVFDVSDETNLTELHEKLQI